jgi:hypothetical protein
MNNLNRFTLDQYPTNPMSVGEICHIISKMTTQRTAKGKKDYLYQNKHKNKLKHLLDF